MRSILRFAVLFFCFFFLTVSLHAVSWQIILPEHPSLTERTAAQELQFHIQKITGDEIPIASEPRKLSADRVISVGDTDFARPYLEKEHPHPFKFDEILIRAEGTDLILTGHQRRGALYAVYTFLEEVCGCRWYAGDATVIPQSEDLVFPPDLSISYAPKLISREPYHDLARPMLFSARNKGNGDIDEKHGGRLSILNWVHSAYHYIPPQKYFEVHPEWFSEIDGERTYVNAQLCLTNDEMRKELTKNVLEELRAHPETIMIDISQNDQFRFCTCSRCKAVDDEEESHAGTLIRFLNQVAADIEKEFPDVLVETLAYQYTRKPPKLTRPRHNIVIRLCTIECDFSRPLGDPESSQANRDFMNDIEGWSQIAPHLLIWDYVTNYDDYIGPHPNWWVLGENIRTFIDHGAIGVFEEGEGQDFCEMKNWVLLKLMWNPELDTEFLMKDFAEGYYGKEVAPYIMEYWRILHESLLKSGKELGCFRAHSSQWLDLATLNKVTLLWRQAEITADQVYGSDSPQVARLRKSRTAIDSVWLTRYSHLQITAKREKLPFEGPSDFKEAARDFARHCIEYKYPGPEIHTEGDTGRVWFESLADNTVTPQPLFIDSADWSVSGAGAVSAEEIDLDGEHGRSISLYSRCGYNITDFTAEFCPDSKQTAFVVIFGADDEENFSYLRLDDHSVSVGAIGPDTETFRHDGYPLEPGVWHSIRLRFTDQHNLFALFVDGKCLYEWLFYPRPEQKGGRIGFFAENGKVSVRDVYVTGTPSEGKTP